MKTIRHLLSKRAFESDVWFQIVWEWENEILAHCKYKLHSPKKYKVASPDNRYDRIIRGANLLGYPFFRRGYTLSLELTAYPIRPAEFPRDTIPWYIDYFLSHEGSKSFVNSLDRVPFALVSSREVYETIVSIDRDATKKVRHLGLSLPNIWMPKDISEWANKDYDLILMGRLPDVFSKYLSIFLEKYPETKVGLKRIENGHFNYYSSSDPSKLIGSADTRAQYMSLMKRSKAFLYSTPGIENPSRTAGFNQVTPRFLEALSCGCHPVMMYTDNADTRYYRLSDFGPSIESYEQFERELLKAIENPMDFEKTINYLNGHTTSARMEELNEIIKSFNN